MTEDRGRGGKDQKSGIRNQESEVGGREETEVGCQSATLTADKKIGPPH